MAELMSLGVILARKLGGAIGAYESLPHGRCHGRALVPRDLRRTPEILLYGRLGGDIIAKYLSVSYFVLSSR